MANGLNKARDFANRIRYSEDNLRADDVDGSDNADLHSYFLQNSILVTPLVTPSIYQSVKNVVSRLDIPIDSLKVFVYASSDIQAECHAGNDVDCIVRISSGLVDILEDEEIEFVIGHEIGHFLYNHGLSLYGRNKSSELSIQKRAQEISADRIGLIACKSLDSSIKAMMKTISGLSSRYLKFDVGGFLSQLNSPSNFQLQASSDSTHPTMLIRCRALLWFSMSDTFKQGRNDYSAREIKKINNRTKEDLDTYVDASSRDKINNLKKDLSIWLSALEIVKSGKFDKEEQKIFSDMFGVSTLDKLKGFLSGLNSDEAINKVNERVEDAKSNLYKEAPISFDRELKEITESVRLNFN